MTQQIQSLPITIVSHKKVLDELEKLGGKTARELRETCAQVVEEVPTDVLQAKVGA